MVFIEMSQEFPTASMPDQPITAGSHGWMDHTQSLSLFRTAVDRASVKLSCFARLAGFPTTLTGGVSDHFNIYSSSGDSVTGLSNLCTGGSHGPV